MQPELMKFQFQICFIAIIIVNQTFAPLRFFSPIQLNQQNCNKICDFVEKRGGRTTLRPPPP